MLRQLKLVIVSNFLNTLVTTQKTLPATGVHMKKFAFLNNKNVVASTSLPQSTTTTQQMTRILRFVKKLLQLAENALHNKSALITPLTATASTLIKSSVLSPRCRMFLPPPAVTAPISVLVLRSTHPVAACRFLMTKSVKLLASVIGVEIMILALHEMIGVLATVLNFKPLILVQFLQTTIANGVLKKQLVLILLLIVCVKSSMKQFVHQILQLAIGVLKWKSVLFKKIRIVNVIILERRNFVTALQTQNVLGVLHLLQALTAAVVSSIPS